MPDTSIVITRLSQANEERLTMRITIEFKKPYYSAAEYEGFKEFYKKLFDLLNEQFVFKKKEKRRYLNTDWIFKKLHQFFRFYFLMSSFFF